MSKTINDYTAAVSIDPTADYFLIEASSTYYKINRSIMLGGITGDPVGTSDSQSLTNKTVGNTNTVTLKDTLFTLQDDGDTTKQAKFQLSGITTGNTRTFTLPDASATLVGTSATQTLTNKTLTSPTITGGTIDNSTITVDSISGHTSATVVTVGGVQMNNGTIGTSSAVVTASINDAAVTPAKLVSGTGSTWALQSYTPTWTNLTVGNATQAFYYIQAGKIVFINGRITLGSTSSVSSNPFFSLPVAASAHYNVSTQQNVIGTCALAAAATVYSGYVYINSTGGASKGQPVALGAGGSYLTPTGLTSTVPNTWTTADYMHFWVSYEVD